MRPTPDYYYNNIATDSDALGAVGSCPLVTADASGFTVHNTANGIAITLADFTDNANRNTSGSNRSGITNNAVIGVINDIITSASLYFTGTFTTSRLNPTVYNINRDPTGRTRNLGTAALCIAK